MTKEKNESPHNEATKVDKNDSTNKKNPSQKRRNKLNPMYSVLTKARKDFSHQKRKETSLKTECIEDVILKYYDDKQRFWSDFNKQARKLVVISTFSEDCKKLKLDPQSIAEHVVFRGKKDFESVRDEGIGYLGDDVLMYKGRIFHDEFKLYEKTRLLDAHTE